MTGPITLDVKQTGERSAGNRQAAFDVAGAGNATMVAGLRATAKAVESPPAPAGARASSRPYLQGPAGAIPVGYSPKVILSYACGYFPVSANEPACAHREWKFQV